jgi:hypothetical protein
MVKLSPEQAEAAVDEWLAETQRRWGFISQPPDLRSNSPKPPQLDTNDFISGPASRTVFSVRGAGIVRPYFGSLRQEEKERTSGPQPSQTRYKRRPR